MSKFLSEVKGFTPVIDVLAQELGLMTAVVYGIVWRYCQMEDKVCKASRERIAEHAGISIKTVERHLEKLCGAGYLKDLTPDRKHKPHIYADAGKARILGLLTVEIDRGGTTESRTSENEVRQRVLPGQTESLTRSDRESYPGQTESLIRIPSYDREEERDNKKVADSEKETLWQAALGELQLQMTKATFYTWVKDTRLVSYEDGTFIIEVKDAFTRDWLENRLLTTIERTLVGIVGHPVEVRFVVSTT